MKLPLATKLTVAILFALISRLLAAEVTIDIKSFTISSETTKDMGFEWLFLPLKFPIDPRNPKIEPFDPNRPIRGTFLPKQFAVVERAFKGRGIEQANVLSRAVTPPAKLDVPGSDASPGFSFAIQSLPGNKLSIEILPSAATASSSEIAIKNPHPDGLFQGGSNSAELAPGSILILSFAGTKADTVTAYYITATSNQGAANLP